MAVREIARRLINGVWTTLDVEEDGGGTPAPLYVQPTDPGAVGAGALWIDTAGVPTLKIRNAADAAWGGSIQLLGSGQIFIQTDASVGIALQGAGAYQGALSVQAGTGTGNDGDIAHFDDENGTRVVKMRTKGMVTQAMGIPADGDLSAGECQFYFDDTPGATKVSFKGKDSNGTVRTGTVSLS